MIIGWCNLHLSSAGMPQHCTPTFTLIAIDYFWTSHTYVLSKRIFLLDFRGYLGEIEAIFTNSLGMHMQYFSSVRAFNAEVERLFLDLPYLFCFKTNC